MDDTTLTVLLATAAFVGFFHTITGPDHYVPFLAMARIGRWSLGKTIAITLACGVGHVFGSVVIGVVGIGAGLAVGGLEVFEGIRGQLAGWLLLGFGLAYLAWGIRRAIRNQPHTHDHSHVDGTFHSHTHAHTDAHAHPHGQRGSLRYHTADERAGSMTPWVLFTIFVFGPCEPLIPILMYPAAKLSLWGVVLVTLVFAVCTLATMTTVVVLGHLGLTRLSLAGLDRYAHAVAGFAIAACGAAIQFGL